MSNDVLEFLDSLDKHPTAPGASKVNKSAQPANNPPKPATTTNTGEAAEALAFLDELTQQSSRPTRVLTPGPRVRNVTTDSVRKSMESARRSGNASPAPAAATTSSANTAPPATSSNTSTAQAAGGWGWGSVWNTASTVIAQAKTVVDEQVKHLPNEQAKKWGGGMMEYVKNAQLDKLGSLDSI